MADEPIPNGRVTARDIYAAVNALRHEMAEEQRERERRSDERIGRLEVIVTNHEAILQQLKGAGGLVKWLIGTNLVAALAAIAALLATLR